MLKILSLIAFPILLDLCFSCCITPTNTNHVQTGPWDDSLKIDLTVLWANTNNPGWGRNMVISGDIGIKAYDGLTAVDLKTGNTIWKFPGAYDDPIIFNSDIITCLSLPIYRIGMDGLIKQKIWLSTNGLFETNGYNNYYPGNELTVHGNRLYWGMGYGNDTGNTNGVISIRIDNLTDTGDHTNFLAYPEVVSYKIGAVETNYKIQGEIGFSDNANILFYFQQDSYAPYQEIVAIDQTTWQRKWVHQIQPGQFDLYGLDEYSNMVIIVDDYAVSFLDSVTGNQLYRGARGNSDTGGTMSGHYFYTATTTVNITNVYCLDLDTKKIVWCDIVPNYDFLVNPIIHNGICWIVGGNCMFLYNALTGKRLGFCMNKAYTSSSFWGNKILVYNTNIMIINSPASDMFAVKMDWGMDSNGNLVRELTP